MNECLHGSHGNMAELFKYLYGDTNIRVLNQDPSKMRFAHWNDEKLLWTIEKKVVLSRLISTVVKPYFDKYTMEIWNKLNSDDEVEKDSAKSKLKI